MSEKNNETHKKIEHTFTVDTKDTVEQEDNELNERINRLYGLSTKPPKEEKHYDPKELEETRKKLILLLLGVILGGIIILLVLLNPLDWGKKKEEPKTEEKEEENVEEEIPLGTINLSNEVVQRLNNLVKFNEDDFLVIDLFPLYTKEVLTSAAIPNNIKLYMMKKNPSFNDMLVECGIEEYIKTCDPNGLTIDKTQFDKLVGETFGPNVSVTYDPINYLYYSVSSNSKKLTLTYNDTNYIVKCNEYQESTVLNKYVQQELVHAVKTKDGIEIYQNVVFISPSGVYKDPSFTTLITNDKAASSTEYLAKGSVYKYTFVETEKANYYLSKIELVKEGNPQ